MIDWQAVGLIGGLWFAALLLPGPNFFLITRHALGGQRKVALGASFGYAIVACIYGGMVLAGLSALLERWSMLHAAIQIAGGCYLIYLGFMSWRYAGKNTHAVALQDCGFLYGVRLGLMASFANPKAMAFFTSVFAVTLKPSTSTATHITILVVGAELELAFYSILAFAFSRPLVANFFEKARRLLDRMIGILLIGFGARMIINAR